MTLLECIRRYRPRSNLALRLSHTLNLEERKGFGSFHSDDIEELIRQPEHSYSPPPHLQELQLKCIPPSFISNLSSRPFGKEMKSLFSIDPNYTFLNHGAFGATLKPLQQEAELWRQLQESQPLKFFDRILLPLIAHSTRALASHLNIPAERLLPLQNVTSGLNAVIQSIESALSPG